MQRKICIYNVVPSVFTTKAIIIKCVNSLVFRWVFYSKLSHQQFFLYVCICLCSFVKFCKLCLVPGKKYLSLTNPAHMSCARQLPCLTANRTQNWPCLDFLNRELCAYVRNIALFLHGTTLPCSETKINQIS